MKASVAEVGRCVRVSRERFLVATLNGRLEEVHTMRCGSANKCAYCARQIALENVMMLRLDGRRGPEPEVWAVLTTPLVTLAMSRLYQPLAQTIKALRRRWMVRYCSLLEYTTGYGPRSGGERRPHLNLLLKGIRRRDVKPAGAIVRRIWCEQATASPGAQHIGTVADVGGLAAYLGRHFQKESQRPPDGFAGQRFNPSKGRWRYWNGELTAAQMRQDARRELLIHALREKAARNGLRGTRADQWVADELARRDELDWTVIQLREDRWGETAISVIGGEPLHIDRAGRPQ